MHEWIDRYRDGYLNGWMSEKVDRSMYGRRVGQMDRWLEVELLK